MMAIWISIGMRAVHAAPEPAGRNSLARDVSPGWEWKRWNESRRDDTGLRSGVSYERKFEKIHNVNHRPDPPRPGSSLRRREMARTADPRRHSGMVRGRSGSAQWPELTQGVTIE